MTDGLFLLDANICIYILRDAGGAVALHASEQDRGALATSSIVYAEVMRGIPVDEYEARDHAVAFFQAIIPLPFDRAAAEIYARLPFKRARFDRLIAAHALSLGLTLVTNNERDFADIADLKVENWTTA